MSKPTPPAESPYAPPREVEAAPVPSTPPHPWHGRALIFVSALLWSTSGLFGKATTFNGWPGGLLAFWRSLFACLVIYPLVRKPQWSWWLVPMALCFVLMIWTFLTSMKLGTAAAAIWLQSTAPVWVLLVGVLLMGETFHRRDLLMVIFGLAGVAVILVFELRGSNAASVICGTTSGVLYGAVIICLRKIRHMDAAWLAAVNHTATVVFHLPYLYWFGIQDASFWPQGVQWAYLAAFGALQIGLPYVLFARGLRDVPGHEAGGIGLIEPVLVPIWTWLAWNEKIAPHVIAGAALIFIGLVWRYLGARPPRVLPKAVTEAT
jgi:drug/metabolite transporter (DMT)-like permease